jgi:hypothetical protein
MNPVSSDPVIRRRQMICASVLVLQGLYQLALLPTLPSLISTHPVLLELLRGSTAAMVAAGAFGSGTGHCCGHCSPRCHR